MPRRCPKNTLRHTASKKCLPKQEIKDRKRRAKTYKMQNTIDKRIFKLIDLYEKTKKEIDMCDKKYDELEDIMVKIEKTYNLPQNSRHEKA